MEKSKKNLERASILLILISLTSLVIAAGVSTPYWDGYPLKLASGESQTIDLVLQNRAGNPEDITFRAELTSDGEGIATLVNGEEYLVPFGTNMKVPIKISIPEDIAIGGTREIDVSFKQISPGDSGMVTLVGGFNTKFPVEIVSVEESTYFEPEPESPTKTKADNYIFKILAAIVLLIIVIWQIVRRKRKK